MTVQGNIKTARLWRTDRGPRLERCLLCRRRQGFGHHLFAVDHLGQKTLTIDIAVLLNTHLEHDSRVLLGGQLGADRIPIAYSMR